MFILTLLDIAIYVFFRMLASFSIVLGGAFTAEIQMQTVNGIEMAKLYFENFRFILFRNTITTIYEFQGLSYLFHIYELFIIFFECCFYRDVTM